MSSRHGYEAATFQCNVLCNQFLVAEIHDEYHAVYIDYDLS